MKTINWKRTMQNLRDALMNAKIPQNVFADRIGISPQQLSNYLNGWSVPSADTFARMQDEIHFQIVWGFGKK